MKYKLFMFFLILLLAGLQIAAFKILPQPVAFPDYVKYFSFLLYLSGIVLGVIGTCAFYQGTSKKAKAYKRELEKESIAGTEASAQIKVLESKIEVLEKALQQALDK